MKYINISKEKIKAPAIVVGCMRVASLSVNELETLINFCIDNDMNSFDHSDIYGDGECEALFGKVLANNKSLRSKIVLQSKCGIVPDKMYDLSKKHILESVDGILKRLNTDYLDTLLLHRPDALTDPCEVADAFDTLVKEGKVRQFGVSNHNPGQIELLKKYCKQEIVFNQLQFSVPVAEMISEGMEVNMTTDGAVNRDGGVLNYCRLNDITIQAWSPFQMPNWQGVFIGSEKYAKLNKTLEEIAAEHNATPTMIATAWILRHPANMQVVSGSTNIKRLGEIAKATEIDLSREEWYRLYLDAGHILP